MNRRGFLELVATLVAAPAAVFRERKLVTKITDIDYGRSSVTMETLWEEDWPARERRLLWEKKLAKAEEYWRGQQYHYWHLDPTAPPSYPEEPLERRGRWTFA